ncbi:MAG: nucleotidyltransferase family protein [Steroidobacteraceae bacterium]
MTTIHALVLAAGAASRFGSPKGLAHYRGRPLIRQVVESVQAAFNPLSNADTVTVILGSEFERLRDTLSGCNVRIVINPEWQRGLSSSIRVGIRALPSSTSAVLMALADQVLVRVDDYRRLIEAAIANPDSPIAARYAEAIGVPAVFPARYFTRLCTLEGDRGAGSLLLADERVVAIDIPNAAFDIDTPEQLAKVNQGR